MNLRPHNIAIYFSFFIGLLTQIFLVRTLDFEVYGKYILILSIVALSQFIIQATSLELNIRIREVHDFNKGVGVHKSLELKLILFCATLTSFYSYYFITDGIILNNLLMVCCIFANFRIGANKSQYLVQDNVPTLNYLEAMFSIIRLISTVIIVYISHEITMLILNLLITIVIQNLIFLIGLRKVEPKNAVKNKAMIVTKKGIFFPVARSSLRQGLPEADIILLASILTPKDLVMFRISKTLAHFIVVIIMPIWRNLQPTFIHESKKKMYLHNILRGHKYSVGILVCSLMGAYLLAEPIIYLIYSVNFGQNIFLLLLLLPAKYLFFTTNSWFKLWCVNSANQLTTLVPALITLVFLILIVLQANIDALPIYGLIILFAYTIYFSLAHLIMFVSK